MRQWMGSKVPCLQRSNYQLMAGYNINSPLSHSLSLCMLACVLMLALASHANACVHFHLYLHVGAITLYDRLSPLPHLVIG